MALIDVDRYAGLVYSGARLSRSKPCHAFILAVSR
jgi:hypothetical protein